MSAIHPYCREEDGDLCVQCDAPDIWWLTAYAIIEPYDPAATDPHIGVGLHWGRNNPHDTWGATGIRGQFESPEKLEAIGTWFIDQAKRLREAQT